MNCTLTPSQQEQLFAKVYKDLLEQSASKTPFDFKSYANNFYSLIKDATKDHALALTYVSLLPQNIRMAFGQNNNIAKLVASSIPDLINHEDEFKDLDNVEKYLDLAPVAPEIVEKLIIADKENSKQPVQNDGPVYKIIDFKGKPSTALATWAQEAYFFPETTKLTEEEQKLVNVADPNKKWHYDIFRQILSTAFETSLPFSEIIIDGHKGIYLTAVSVDQIPENSLYPEMKDPKVEYGLRRAGMNRGVALALSDANGNFLYFDENNKITYAENGKVPHTFMRIPNKVNGKYDLAYGKIISPQKLLNKEIIERKANKIEDFTKEELDKRLAEIENAQQEEYKNLERIAKFISKKPKANRVTLDITNGSMGTFDDTELTPLSESNVTLNEIRAMDLGRTGANKKGFASITIPGVQNPVKVDRIEMPDDIADKMADMLLKKISVDGVELFPQERLAYIKQFLLPDATRYPVIIINEAAANPMTIQLDGKVFTLPALSDEPNPETKAKLVKYLSHMKVWEGGKLYKARINFDNKLLKGKYVDYTITGNTAVKNYPDYAQFIKDNAKMYAAVNGKGDVADLNAYLTFAIPDQVHSKIDSGIDDKENQYYREEVKVTPIEEKKETSTPAAKEVKESPLKKKDILPDSDDLLNAINKSRTVDNKATKEQITAAKAWYDKSPLKGKIPYNTLFNIVNSDAFAQWNLDGITLFAGSNFTDIYHEAWHGFSQLYLSPSEKDTLYSEVRKNTKSFTTHTGKTIKLAKGTDLEIEEWIAEGFRKYAMNGGKSTGNAKIDSIFKRIWDYLKAFFTGVTPTDVVTHPESIKIIKDLYDKLYFGQLNEYKPSTSNVQFLKLNKSTGIQPIKEDTEPFTLEESRLLTDTVDSLMSEVVNKKNTLTNSSKFTTAIFTNKANLNAAYSYIKNELINIKKYNQFLADKTEDEFEKEKLLNKARLLDKAVENFGELDKTLAKPESEGLISFHRKKSQYLGITARIIEDDTESPEKSDRLGDKLGNELSLKELAHGEILYLIKSLYKVKDGGFVKNDLDVNQLVDFDKVWNSLARTLSGTKDPMDIYRKLVAAQNIHPEFKQLISKLGMPYTEDAEVDSLKDSPNYEFDMWIRFAQAFNKPKIPLIQLILDKKTIDLESGPSTSYGIRTGRMSGEISSAKFNFKDAFQNSSPKSNPFVKLDAGKNVYLDIPKVISEFSKNGHIPLGEEYNFIKALGFNLDDTPEVRKDVTKLKAVLGLDFILESLKKVHQYNIKNPNKTVVIYNPISFLEVAHPELEIGNNGTRVKEIIELHTIFSDDYANFSARNAENNLQYEHSLNSSMSILVGAINEAKTFDDLLDMPNMDHFNPIRNPYVLSSVMFNSIFHLDVSPADSEYGTKRKVSREKNAPDVQLNIENLAGTQIVVDSLYPETGISTSKSDRATKFLSDYHMMLLNGKSSLMTHGSKSSIFGLGVDRIYTNPSKQDSSLYIDITSFITPEGSDNYVGFNAAYDILKGYLNSELNRVKEVRTNKKAYLNAKGYNKEVSKGVIAGEVLTAFDRILTDETKDKLYTLITKGEFITEISKPQNAELNLKVREEIKSYFDNLVIDNEAIMDENKFIHPDIYGKVTKGSKGIPKVVSEKAAMRAFTYNQWINNFESTIMLYGDIAQYNHAKEEFHKRISGVASTGTIFAWDKGTQAFINRYFGKPYANSLISRNELDIKSPKLYDGTLGTGIIKDMEVESAYFDVYEKAFREDLTRIYSKSLSGKSLTEKVNEKLYGINGTREDITGGKLGPYAKMNEADGQGYVTFDSYRMLRKLEGEWGAKHESLFQDIIAGREVSTSEALTFFPPYKVQHYGPLQNSVKENGLPITAFHKFSLAPLIPNVIKGTPLEAYHTKMMNENIDYSLFESGSKIGSITSDGKADRIYSQVGGERLIDTTVPFTTNTIHISYLKNQQAQSDVFKHKVIFSTQLRKLIIEGLVEQGIPITQEIGKMVKSYEDNIDRLTELKKQELLREAGWKEDDKGNLSGNLDDLLDIVRNELEARDISDHEIELLEVDPATGQLRYDLSLHPSAERIEKVLTSIVNNRLIRQKVNGESLVQLSTSMLENIGFKSKFTNPTDEERQKYLGTNDLPTYHPGEDGKTNAMKVKIAFQGNFEKLLRLKDKDGNRIGSLEKLNSLIKDDEWLNQGNNRKSITMVAVRIPVQGLNSMEFMEVYEFLPPSAGNIIIAPSEIVAKSGSDFDIDKLSIMMPTLMASGELATTGKYNSVDEITAEIKVLEKERDVKLEKLETKLKALKGKKELSKALLEEVLQAKDEASSNMNDVYEDIIDIVNKLKGTKRMNLPLVAAVKNQDHPAILAALDKINNLSKIDEELSIQYNKLKNINTDVLDDSLKSTSRALNSEISAIEDKIYSEKQPLSRKIKDLKEQKRVFINAVENQLISDIRNILALPENFVSLITANDTNVAKPISAELEKHVQKYKPKDGKNISPSRVLEYEYNLYKHESNNIGKKTLGMAAVENTYNTIFNRIGAYLQKDYTYTDKKGKTQKRRMKLLLNHHTYRYKDSSGKEWDGISLSNLYDVQGENKVSEIISQIMNGLVDIEKDTWISNLQGNTEIMPVLLFLLKTGVPLQEAAWFVSQPLIREYVDLQRTIKSTFAGPLGKAPSNPNFYKFNAVNEIMDRLGLTPENGLSNAAIYTVTQEETKKALGESNFTKEQIESIVENNDKTSSLAKAGFLHFLEIEQMMQGVRDLKFKTNFDTKKSPDLYSALRRVADVQALAENSRIPSDMIDKVLDSILGSFFIQDFQLKLWSKLFPFRTDDFTTEWITDLINNPDNQDAIHETSDDEETFVKNLKNSLISFIFQNEVKGFNIRTEKEYKGYSVKDSVPIKAVDKLEHGAFVKNGVMYVDKSQLESDYNNKLYTKAAAEEENSYAKRGLAPLNENTFIWRGKKNKNEYAHFVLERENLRSITSIEDFKKMYESTIKTYEEYLRDQALKNIFNLETMFSAIDPESVANKFLNIINLHPKLIDEYALVANLGVSSDKSIGTSGVSNLMLKDTDLNAYKLNNYHENYMKLSDPGVAKVANPEENLMISNYFRDLSTYAYLQSGLSSNKYSITNVVSPKPFQTIMKAPLAKFSKEVLQWEKLDRAQALKQYGSNIVKMLDTNPKYHTLLNNIAAKKEGNLYLFNKNAAVLNTFYQMFLHNNGLDNRKLRTRVNNYVVPNVYENVSSVNNSAQPFTSVENARTIYDKINKDNKTQSENVEIPGKGDLKDVTYDSKTFWSEIVPEAKAWFGDSIIVAYRGNHKKTFDQNFKSNGVVKRPVTIGNPFDWQNETGTRDEKGIKSTKKFIHWMITGDNMGIDEATEEYRQTIINNIKSGELKGRPIIYYQEKGYATHATALDYLINKHDWNKSSQVVTPNLTLNNNKVFSKTNRPDIFTFNANQKGGDLVEMAKKHPNLVFAHNDSYNSVNKNLTATGTEGDLKQLDNAFGIRTASISVNGPWGTKTQEHVEKVKGYIESDLAPLINAKKMGKTLIFPSQGLGNKLQSTDPEVFIYLSKRLYEEFGYLNPGSIKEVTVRDLVDRMQGISQNEVEELKRQCI
jgi:hypothetical protein